MKKILVISVILASLLVSCVDSKTFKREDGTEFVARPYGWMNKSDFYIDGVQYETCTGNIVLSIITSETIFGPILLTGLELYQPVDYVEPVGK